MATALAQVKVSRVEGGNGFAIICSCGVRAIRPFRHEADEVAQDHARSHVIPDPADQVWDV